MQEDSFQHVFAGQAAGSKEVHDQIWLVSLMDCDLRYFDLEGRILERLNPRSILKVLPSSRYLL